MKRLREVTPANAVWRDPQAVHFPFVVSVEFSSKEEADEFVRKQEEEKK